MFPVIFSLGPVTIYSYAVVMCIAFFAAAFVIWKRARDLHFEEEALFDAVMVILFWMFIGSRLGYILSHWPDFQFNIFSWLNVFGRPGMWFLGGLLGGILGVYQQARRRKWDMYALSDVLVPGLILGQAIMSFGAFLNGSEVGYITESFLGVRFMGMYDKRLPVQLWESILFGCLFVLIWRAEGAYRTFRWYKGSKSEANSGYVTAVYLVGWGIIKFVLAFFRPGQLSFSGMKIDYAAYLAVCLLGLWVLIRRSGMNYFKYITYLKVKNVSKIRKNSRGTPPLTLGDDIFG